LWVQEYTHREGYAPVGIRTRAPGSTGRDHRPLDHRGSGRRKVRSLIILSYRDESARGLAFEKTSFRVRAAGRSGQCVSVAWGWSSKVPFYRRSVMWIALTA